MSRRPQLANRLQVGAHPIVHLLRIGIAERVAHIEGDLAEERYREIERRPGLLDIQNATQGAGIADGTSKWALLA